jgi:hypothetical protein
MLGVMVLLPAMPGFHDLDQQLACGASVVETYPMQRLAAILLLLSCTVPATAQEAGWHYSPLAGEGDRAALGCSYGAGPQSYTCLAVRCEADFSIGLHVHTSRPGGDSGRWGLEFDKEGVRFEVSAVADGSPYHARIEGDVAPILQQLKDAGLVYLDPADGPPIDRAISLSGSLYAINQALYFCAPKAPAAEPTDQPAM